MGFFNWLMSGIGFEDENEGENQEQRQQTKTDSSNLKDEKRRYKELKKQEKLKRKLERQKARNARYNTESEQSSFVPTETVFEEPVRESTFDPDQYNISSQDQNQYSSNGYDSAGYSQGTISGYGNKNIIFFYPKSYSEVQQLITYLKNGQPVMLNLDGITDEEAQRMLDFASGAVYALTGSIQRVSGNIFLLTPEGLGIITPKK